MARAGSKRRVDRKLFMQSPSPLARLPCVVAEHVGDPVDKSAYRVIRIAVVIVESKAHGEIAANVRALESRLRKAQIGLVGDVTRQTRSGQILPSRCCI